MTSNTGPAVDALIHVADGVVYGGLDYAVRIEQHLQAAGLRTARHDLTRPNRMPPRVTRLHVLTGGATSVSDDVPWMRSAIETAERLVAEANDGAHTVVGVCLGSQILAEAVCPGSIMSSERIEVGLTVVSRPDEGGWQTVVPTFHYESIASSLAAAAAHTTVDRYSNDLAGDLFERTVLDHALS